MATMQAADQVSVVIPSWQRHKEVVRAVMSALKQTRAPLEVIVANDGPDPGKARLMAAISDDRVRYVEAPRRANASATRNFGVRHAHGTWIALLDDDDVWLPGKLEAQFVALARSRREEAILAGVEVVYAHGRRRYERPRGTDSRSVPMSEFLFCGSGGVHTSTLMAPRWAFEKYPFDEVLEQQEDWTWMLQAGQSLPLVVAPEEVCERHCLVGSGLTRPGRFCFSQMWYLSNKHLMTSQACAAHVAGVLARKAAYDIQPGAVPWMFRELRGNGLLTPSMVARILLPWLAPGPVRGWLKVALRRN